MEPALITLLSPRPPVQILTNQPILPHRFVRRNFATQHELDFQLRNWDILQRPVSELLGKTKPECAWRGAKRCEYCRAPSMGGSSSDPLDATAGIRAHHERTPWEVES
jgi:hypothetical protein